MANLVYINFSPISGRPINKNGNQYTNQVQIVAPLLDDVQLETNTEFVSLGDLLPQGIGSALDLASSVIAFGGTANKGLLNLQSMISAPKWSKTEPVSITLRLPFYTVTDSYSDVYWPITELVSLSILKVSGNIIKTPGISLTNLSATYLKSNQGKNIELDNASIVNEINSINDSTSPERISQIKDDVKRNNAGGEQAYFDFKMAKKTSSLVAVYIPGVLLLRNSIVTSARPTFSRQTTTTGYPLWGEVELTVKGVMPATSLMFTDLDNQDQAFAALKSGINGFDTPVNFVSKKNKSGLEAVPGVING